jgi:hypothetical protein
MTFTLWDGTGAELAAEIHGVRKRHLVVISQRTDSDMLNLDADYVAREVDGLADVIVVRNITTTYELSDALPADWSVFGNSARVYPAGLAQSQGQPTRYVVALAAAELRSKADELIELATALPLPPAAVAEIARPSAPPVTSVECSGTISAFFGAGERAWVDFPDGSHGSIRQEDVIPGVRLDWLLTRGQTVAGTLHLQAGIFDISAAVRVPRRLQAYRWGEVVLALVEEVDSATARLSLLPGDTIAIRLEDITSNPLDTADELLTAGQVVAARLKLDRGISRLSLIDVDDDEAVAPVPVLVRGGTPWLEPGRHLLPPSPEEMTEAGQRGAAAVEPQSVVPAAGEASAVASGRTLKEVLLQLEASRAESRRLLEQLATHDDGQLVASLSAEVESLEQELQESAAEIHRLQTDLRRKTERLIKAQDRSRKAERSSSRSSLEIAQFATEEEQFRHELYVAWVERVEPAEKRIRPLQEFSVGPKFLESFYRHSPEHRRKALKALVDLLTRRAPSLPARQLHALRSGEGAEDAPVTRAGDGARCWRMAVELNVPAARRIHYWEVPGGGLELHELVPHDVTAA